MKSDILKILLPLFLLTTICHSQDNAILADTQYGCDSLNVQFSLETTSGIISAQWDFGNGETYNGINPPPVHYAMVGSYDVSVVLDPAETITQIDFIGVFPPPVATFSINDSIFFGTYNVLFTVDSQAVPFDTVEYFYSWDFGDGISYVTTSNNHGHRYPSAGTYYIDLIVNDRYGCESTAMDTILIKDAFSVGNIFTPNDDNINDEFIVETNGRVPYSMVIFTRNGTKVYETEGPTLRWDGRNNSGVKMPAGIYYYIIKEINGIQNKPGFIYLMYDTQFLSQ